MTYGANTFAGAPSDGTLTAVVQGTRVQLTLVWPGVGQVTIYRNDPDGVSRPVRNAEPGLAAGSMVAYDHEAPLDVPVTYTASATQGQVLVDTFSTRVLVSDWGAAESGQVYTESLAADCSTSGAVGRIQPSSTERLVYAETSSFEFDVMCDASIGNLPASTSLGVGVTGRVGNGGNDNYNLRYSITTTGVMSLVLGKRFGGTGAGILTVPLSTIYVAGTFYRIRLRHYGTTLQGKIWLPGTPEPVGWAINTTDTVNVPAPGTGAGTFARNDSGVNTNVMSYDNLSATSTQVATFTSNTVTVTSGGRAWLKDPGRPSVNRQVVIADLGGRVLGARQGVFRPGNNPFPVVVSDVRQSDTGTVAFFTDGTSADIKSWRTMLAPGSFLLLQYPAAYGGESIWISVGAVPLDPTGRKATSLRRKITVPFEVIDRPPGGSLGPVGQTWADVKATYATWSALTATGKTWAQLAQSVT